MNTVFLSAALLHARRIQATAVLMLLASVAFFGPAARGEEAPKQDDGEFFELGGAKDCAFDAQRQRLFVTNEKEIAVFDTKKRELVKSMEVMGKVRACDISPDFKYLAVAPLEGQFLYWIQLEDLEITQVRFKASASETGVFDLCVGADNSVLFSTTFAGSGWVTLRKFDPKTTRVTELDNVRMDSVVAASGDRQFAAVAEGNISSGPLQLYDFQKRRLKKVADLQCFNYEIACSRGARYFASPGRNGCVLYDGEGVRLGVLEGKPVICAAFSPKTDHLFVLRHGESTVQEYDVQGQSIANEYPLDKALAIKGDVHSHIVANVHSSGSHAFGSIRRVVNVNHKTFQSGRVKVSDDGEHLFAVVPTGVYMFSVKSPGPSESGTAPNRPKIKVIEAK
jgi:hypothetical protein